MQKKISPPLPDQDVPRYGRYAGTVTAGDFTLAARSELRDLRLTIQVGGKLIFLTIGASRTCLGAIPRLTHQNTWPSRQQE